jgi:CubicO group peptidase (beta-lactamase class C family)
MSSPPRSEGLLIDPGPVVSGRAQKGNSYKTAALAHAYAVAGQESAAHEVLNKLLERAKTEYVSPYEIAVIYAGLGDYFEHPDFYPKKETLRDISDFLRLVYGMKLVAKPGEKFSYSNSGYVLLGAVIEKVSGQLYRMYINEKIFKPLGMNDTGIIFIEDIVPNVATGYYPKNADELQSNILVHGRACSAGGIYSTVNDLSKFDQGLRTDKILKKEFIQKMYEPSKTNPEYGLGWEILDIQGHKVLGHSGGHYGIEAYFSELSMRDIP